MAPRTQTEKGKCEKCEYWRKLHREFNTYACHYCLDNGRLRGCSVAECDKFLPRKRGRKPNRRRRLEF